MDYQTYLSSNRWHQLKGQYLYSKKRKKCFVCGKTYHLLLHHIHYPRQLGTEKMYLDVVIVCYQCHQLCHTVLFIKLPLKRWYLLFRLLDLRISHAVTSLLTGHQ